MPAKTPAPKPEAYHSPPELGRQFGKRPSYWIDRIKANELEAINLSNGVRPKYLVSQTALEAFLRARQVTPAPPPARKQRRDSTIPRYV